MMQRRENELDALFKRKLGDLDMGRQDHLWQGIADQLSKNKRSNRMIGFAWFSGVLLSFTLLGLGIITAYKYNLDKKSEGIQSSKPKSEVALENLEPLNVKQIIGNNNEAGQIENQELKRSSLKKISSEQSKIAANQKVIKNYNINNLVNQQTNTKSSTTEAQVKTNSRLALSSNLNQKVSETNITNSTNGFSNVSPSGTENFKEEIVSNSSNSLESKPVVENENLLELSNNNSNSSNKDEELSLINSKKKNKLVFNNKANFKRLKLPINDYCIARNLTPLHHFDIDLYYSPEIATRTISAKSENATTYAQKRAGSESFSGASSFGLRVSYVTKGGLAFRTGLNYSSISEKFEYFDGKKTNTEIIYDQFNKPIDTIYTEVDKIGNQKNYYKFIDIPIMLGYEIDISDFVFSFNAGVGLNLSTKYYGKIYDLEGMKPIGFNNFVSENGSVNYFRSNVGTSLLASFGLNYKLNGRFLLLAEPNLRYYLNSLTTNGYPLEQRYLQLGIAVGLRYRFY